MSYVVAPSSIEEAVDFLVAHPEARPMSGGASLVAMKNARLVAPSHVVNLAGIAELRGIEATGAGIRIGGMSRHREIAECELLTGDLATIRLAAGQIGNRVVRNMGTIGGAIGNADPAADYFPALVCADAHVEIRGPSGERRVSVEDYLVDWFETVLEPGEIVTGVILAAPREGSSVYRKLARTPGDYATASVACTVHNDQLRVAVGACGPKPLRDRQAEAAMSGKLSDAGAIADLCEALVKLADPIDDVRGSIEYRLALIPRMVTAAIEDARDGL